MNQAVEVSPLYCAWFRFRYKIFIFLFFLKSVEGAVILCLNPPYLINGHDECCQNLLRNVANYNVGLYSWPAPASCILMEFIANCLEFLWRGNIIHHHCPAQTYTQSNSSCWWIVWNEVKVNKYIEVIFPRCQYSQAHSLAVDLKYLEQCHNISVTPSIIIQPQLHQRQRHSPG